MSSMEKDKENQELTLVFDDVPDDIATIIKDCFDYASRIADAGYVFDIIPKEVLNNRGKDSITTINKYLIEIINRTGINKAKYMVYDNQISFKSLSQDELYFLTKILKPYKKYYHFSKPRFVADKDEKLDVMVCGVTDRLILKSEIDWLNRCKGFLESGNLSYLNMYQFSMKEAVIYSENYLIQKYRTHYVGSTKSVIKTYYKELKSFMDNLIHCR